MLKNKTVKELKKICQDDRERYKGYSKYTTKAKLIKFINSKQDTTKKIKSKGLQGSVRNPNFKYGSIEKILKAFPPSDDRFIVRLYDAKGIAYTKNIIDRWNKVTGVALMSVNDYSLHYLFKKGDVLIIVYESKSVSSGGSGSVRITDKIFHKEKFSSIEKKKQMTKSSGGKKVSSKNKITIKDIQEILKEKNFYIDRFGNWKNEKIKQRVKFSTTSFRIEDNIGSNPDKKTGKKSKPHWVKVGGGYYKEYKIENNKLIKIKKPSTKKVTKKKPKSHIHDDEIIQNKYNNAKKLIKKKAILKDGGQLKNEFTVIKILNTYDNKKHVKIHDGQRTYEISLKNYTIYDIKGFTVDITDLKLGKYITTLSPDYKKLEIRKNIGNMFSTVYDCPIVKTLEYK